MDAKEVVFLYFLPIAWTILWFRQNKTESYTENQCIPQCRRTKQCRGTWVPSCARCSSYSSWSPLAVPPLPFQNKIFWLEYLQGPDLAALLGVLSVLIMPVGSLALKKVTCKSDTRQGLTKYGFNILLGSAVPLLLWASQWFGDIEDSVLTFFICLCDYNFQSLSSETPATYMYIIYAILQLHYLKKIYIFNFFFLRLITYQTLLKYTGTKQPFL